MSGDVVYGLIFAAMSAHGRDDDAARLVPCSSDGCINLARWSCNWPGDTCAKCNACRGKLAWVAKTLGFELPATELVVPPLGLDDAEQRFSLLELS